MPRSRVLSFMSQWGSAPRSPTEDSFRAKPSAVDTSSTHQARSSRGPADVDSINAHPSTHLLNGDGGDTPPRYTASQARADARPPRPTSMMHTYTPPQADVAADTPPELQPIFTYLNSHGNKLYQEGYFLKLHDLDSRGRPSQDRTWIECFAQLIGTVLSLWDAAALDAAGEDGEVVPTFINLSDASIKMIESLPMNGAHSGNLQNVLSISTAANNRYLLHFNSLNSLTQWTAGIRLAMFEHATLQEAYTGSLVAGKGRYLNNIKQIMERSKFAHEDWARVRFGAGTPWQRCWCVISPPDEKEFARAQKSLKKTSAYERVRLPKGTIKFYDTRKVNKKTQPLATITDSYAAYAIYPQSKPLIDQSTLVKLEGLITLHTATDTTAEGFVFVMPEVHPAVTGFEMMLRWLFPVYDTFGLYGRPNRLVADSLDQRGLMFAMPRDRSKYGYLDLLDVSGLIVTKGSQTWSERQWRRELKKLTSERMNVALESSQPGGSAPFRRSVTNVRFGDAAPSRSSPGSRSASPNKYSDLSGTPPVPPSRIDSAPSGQMFTAPHKRSVSDAVGYRKLRSDDQTRLSYERTEFDEDAPEPPRHGTSGYAPQRRPLAGPLARIQSESEVPTLGSTRSPLASLPAPVGTPPTMMHQPNSRPPTQPYQAPELRRAHSNVDAATLSQMKEAAHPPDEGVDAEGSAPWSAHLPQRQQNMVASTSAPRDVAPFADLPPAVGQPGRRDPRQKLSPIPGSPYVPQDPVFPAAEHPAVVPMEVVDESEGDERGVDEIVGGTPLAPTKSNATLQSSRSIARKPLPKNLPPTPGSSQPVLDMPPSPPSPINTEGLEGGLIDDAALERVLNADRDRLATMNSATTKSSEPDYASTVASSSHAERQSPERPRAGKMKTVGNADLPSTDPRSGGAGRLDTWHVDQATQSTDIPVIDFGPTYAYKPTSRPGTGGTLTPDGALADQRRSKSADARSRSTSRDRLAELGTSSARNSPRESSRLSYFEMRVGSGSPGRLTPTGMNEPARQVVGYNDGSPNHRSITPEQWVQERAFAAKQIQQYVVPVSAHSRNESNTMRSPGRKLTKARPRDSKASADLGRPHSRGASVSLEAAGSTLSAKEQMMVSRATGTPLLGMQTEAARNVPEHGQQPQPGLVGFVGARERERVEARNSTVMQNAILERQYQQQQQQMQAGPGVYPQYQHQRQQSQQYAQHQFQQQIPRNLSMEHAQYTQQMQRPELHPANTWSHARQTSQGMPSPGTDQYAYSEYYAPSAGHQTPQQQQGQAPATQAYGASFYNQQHVRR